MQETLDSRTTRCVGCLNPLRAGARFCPNCGRTTLAESIAIITPHRRSLKSKALISIFDSHWKEIKQVGWLFALLLATSLILGISRRFTSSPWLSVVATLVDALIVLVFAGIRYRDIVPLIGRPKFHLHGIIDWVTLSFIFVVVMTAYFSAFHWLGISSIRVSRIYATAGWPVVSMFILISVSPAIVEELAFRGVIQSTLQRIVSEREALLIQAALFSVLHLLPMMFISHFFMGLCFGYMRVRAKSLYPSMALHALWNAGVLCQELHYL